MMRVSPPELARELPGPQASSRVTRAPRRRRYRAVQPPKAPAPTTATWGAGLTRFLRRQNTSCLRAASKLPRHPERRKRPRPALLIQVHRAGLLVEANVETGDVAPVVEV